MVGSALSGYHGPMQVRYSIKLKSAADRPHLDGMLHEIVGQCVGLSYEIRDSPEKGALGLPLWTAVSFSAQHGPDRALKDEVNAAIEQAGLIGRFEPA